MDKKVIAKQLPDNNDPPKVKPVIKQMTVTHKEDVSVHADVEIPLGYAYVIPIIGGREDETQAFFYPLKNVNKVYGNAERFIIKKKGNQ